MFWCQGMMWNENSYFFLQKKNEIGTTKVQSQIQNVLFTTMLYLTFQCSGSSVSPVYRRSIFSVLERASSISSSTSFISTLEHKIRFVRFFISPTQAGNPSNALLDKFRYDKLVNFSKSRGKSRSWFPAKCNQVKLDNWFICLGMLKKLFSRAPSFFSLCNEHISKGKDETWVLFIQRLCKACSFVMSCGNIESGLLLILRTLRWTRSPSPMGSMLSLLLSRYSSRNDVMATTSLGGMMSWLSFRQRQRRCFFGWTLGGSTVSWRWLRLRQG